MKSFKAQISVAAVCIVLGLMLAYQFRAVKSFSNLAVSKKVEDLSSQLNEAQKQKDDLEKSIQDLEEKIEEYEQNAASSGAYANSLKKELDNMRILAGQTNVEGPGIIITVEPMAQDFDPTQKSAVSFMHLLPIINELNASGAEAIMINNQRIVSTTQIRDAGSTIIINGVRLSAFDKFEIKAIGDPTTLEVAINLPGGVKDELMSWYGIDVRTQKSDNIVVLKYNKVIEFKYASPSKPAKEGEKN